MTWLYIVTWTLLTMASVNHHEYDEFGRYIYTWHEMELSHQSKEKYFENRDSAFAFYNRARIQLDIEDVKIDSMKVWDDWNCDSVLLPEIILPKLIKSTVPIQYFDIYDTLILSP